MASFSDHTPCAPQRIQAVVMALSRSLVMSALVIAATAVPAGGAGAAGPAIVRLDGVGPLRLGMTRAAALRTGWLSARGKGCELATPTPITYRLAGPQAPRALRGTAQFDRGRLDNLSFTRGARTALGVTVARTTTARMVSRYRKAGYQASSQFTPTFQGTFATVKKNGRQVVGAFAQSGTVVTTLAIPAVPVCE
jgi:hypothetical protein